VGYLCNLSKVNNLPIIAGENLFNLVTLFRLHLKIQSWFDVSSVFTIILLRSVSCIYIYTYNDCRITIIQYGRAWNTFSGCKYFKLLYISRGSSNCLKLLSIFCFHSIHFTADLYIHVHMYITVVYANSKGLSNICCLTD
jgi:hypothetical protein